MARGRRGGREGEREGGKGGREGEGRGERGREGKGGMEGVMLTLSNLAVVFPEGLDISPELLCCQVPIP